MAYGKTIELFLVNGTADSFIITELSIGMEKQLRFLVLRFLLVIVRILHRQVYISYFVRKMMVLILYTLEKWKILKKDLYSI